MAKLKAEKRNKLPKSEFGMPGERKYPMNDASHAKNAKARASQMEKKGKLSPASKAKIDAKADRVLGKKKGMSHVSPKRIHAYSKKKG
jgi:hypothetical protein